MQTETYSRLSEGAILAACDSHAPIDYLLKTLVLPPEHVRGDIDNSPQPQIHLLHPDKG